MEQEKAWENLGFFGVQLGLQDNVFSFDLDRIRQWESIRLQDHVEWSLIVLPLFQAYEQRGSEYKTSFHGFSHEEYTGAILSHTHVDGLPPSPKDVELLLNLPRVLQFRVAGAHRPTIVLNRVATVSGPARAEIFWRIHNRVRSKVSTETTPLERANLFWTEIQEDLDRLGIRWSEES